jgi:hypothetical protein
LSYGQKLGKSFNAGIKVFVRFFEIFSLVIVTVFPFLLVFAAAGVGTFFLRKCYLNIAWASAVP